MFAGLEAASLSAAQGESEGGAAGEAGTESDGGSAWFLLPSTVKRLGEADMVGDKLHIHTEDTKTSPGEDTHPNTKLIFLTFI